MISLRRLLPPERRKEGVEQMIKGLKQPWRIEKSKAIFKV
jgi:hypothetical protein